MKFDAANAWHYSLLVFIVCGVVFALALRFWLQAPLYAQFPDPFKYWGTAGGYLVTCWFLITHRPK